MGTVQVLTKERMLAIEAASVVSGLVDGSGHLILTKHDDSTVDAGNVKGATGSSPVYPVGPFPGGLGTQYSRLAILDGLSGTSGAHIEFVLSGLGNYGTAGRGTVLVDVSQRGSGVISLNAWSWGFANASASLSLYIRPMGPFLFEVWGAFASYTMSQGMLVLAKTNATVNIDSASTTMPSGLVLQTIDKAMSDVDTQAALLADKMPIEKTTLTATVPDTNTCGWYVKGADNVTYGPLSYSSSWIPTPGDEVFVTKDGDGTFSIAGAKGDTKPLNLASTSNTYRRGFLDPNWEEPSYTLRNGFVQLNGLILTSNVTAYSKVIFTLPPEARPDTTNIYSIDRSGAIGAIYVRADGTVTLEAGFVANTYISLSSIMYPAAGKANWTTIPTAYLNNGWVDYYGIDQSFGTARYWVDEYGYVWYAGMLRAGTPNTTIFTFPVSHPALSDIRGHVLGNASNGPAYFYIPNAGTRGVGVAPAGMATGWLSLANLSYPSVTAAAATTWFVGTTSAGASGGPNSLYMGSGWVNYDGAETTWGKLRIGQRPDGMVMTRGLLASGTFGSQSGVLALKEEWSRTRSIVIPTISNGAYGRIDIHGTFNRDASKIGTITMNSGSSAWFSLDGLKWFPD